MAKKKVKKNNQEKVLSDVAIELIGVALIFASVLIVGQLGLIGTILKRLLVFMVGEFYWLVTVYVTVISLRMMITRRLQPLFIKDWIGAYLIFISLLLFSHLPVYRFFIAHDLSLLEGVWGYYWTNNVLGSNFIVGGGIVGAFLYGIFVPLISANGLYVVSVLGLIYGTLLLFGVSFKDVFDFIKKQSASIFVSEPKKQKVKKERVKSVKEVVEQDQKNPHPTSDLETFKTHFMNTEQVPTIEETPELSVRQQILTQPEPNTEDFKVNDFTDTISESASIDVTGTLVEAVAHDYELPPLDLLEDYQQTNNSQRMLVGAKANARKLEDTFKNFDVKAKVQEVHIGPAVTRFEILPNVGVKVSKVLSLTDDIALALAAKDIRIEAPIPGKSAIGIEVPNAKQSLVTFKEILKEVPAKVQQEKLLMVLGRDISGKTVYSPLNKMPHLLVAGATGSGKSVCINTIICSIIMRATPNEVKLLMVDPKKVELNGYNGIPHLLAPVVTDARLASLALKKVVSEMEYRYDLFSKSGTRNIESYNEYVKATNESGETVVAPLPFIVVIIDELADLMMVASKEVEECIMRLTQMARAAGIHLIIATQRPSVDVITGVIKANIPSRIAFGVSSSVDSRTIIDTPGAEKLLGKGDMLFVPMGANNPTRVQGAFISDEEVNRIVQFTKDQVAQEELKQDFLANIEQLDATAHAGSMDDPLMQEVLQYMMDTKKASASLIQRRFRVGYNRAARIIDDLEAQGIIGPSEGSKPREVLVTDDVLQDLLTKK